MLENKLSMGESPVEKRRIRISSKRQITIPAKYYESLKLSKEVDCICANGMLILTPVRNDSNVFAEEILADLIEQGYHGEKLLNEFKRISRQVRPAVERLIEEADALAREASVSYIDHTDDIFGIDDESED